MTPQHSLFSGSLHPFPGYEAQALAAALQQTQIDIEAEKGALASTLHDDLGGLMVGAIMDMGWIANQPGLPDAVERKLARAQVLMRAAIDMARDLIENLRPTLLDAVGLYSTLRWHMKASCEAASVSYSESFPSSEQMMNTEIKLGVFRIFQEALKSALSHSAPAEVALTVEVLGDILHCHLMHRSTVHGVAEHSVLSPETSMQQRAERVGGTLQWSETPTGGRHMHLQVPLLSPDCERALSI